ncbi:MAG: NADPH-dependent FMN reductase, partial [Myxococcota bacterium]
RSYNAGLLRAAAEVAPPGVTLELASIAGIPLYDADVEAASGIPPLVTALKDRIAAADGLVLATPEYNNGIPGVFKNAIDWLSRPPADIPRVFGDRPVALIGATPGQGGTRLAQLAWLPVLHTLGMRVFSGKSLYVAGAGALFDATGRLADDRTRERLAAVVAGFARFAVGRAEDDTPLSR